MAFKIILRNACGLDVHKTWIYACIGIADNFDRVYYKEKRFSSFSKGLHELADWLASYSCKDVCMESTGKYWIPVFNILEKTCKVVLAHPKYTKPQRGNKTDRKDAQFICDLFMCGMIKPSFIPPADIREIRDLVRYRSKLVNTITGEKNRARNCLTVSNLKLDDVFSDVFGKSARSITEYMLAHPGQKFDVTPFVDGRCKAPIEEIQAAVDGAISDGQAVKLRECLNHIDELEKHKEKIEQEILSFTDKYKDTLDLIRTVPGLDKNPFTSIQILSEIGADMSVFPTDKNLVSWAGCCPRNDRSASHIKSTRISRAGSYLKPVLVQIANAIIRSKPVLVQIANAIIRSKDHPEFANRYKRIKAHRGHKKAIIAICRMLLTAIWHILSDKKPYTADGFNTTTPVKEKTVLTKSQALFLLRQRGYIIRDDEPQTSV